jgi:hypothetical protein
MSKEVKTKGKKQLPLEISDWEAELLSHGVWTVRVPPATLTVLGEYITSGTMVLRNCGPDKILIDNGRQNEGIALESGDTRIIYVYQHVSVYSNGEKSALVAFQYIPGLK